MLEKKKRLKALIYLAGYNSIVDFAGDVGIDSYSLYTALTSKMRHLGKNTKVRVVKILNEKITAEFIRKPLTVKDVFGEYL